MYMQDVTVECTFKRRLTKVDALCYGVQVLDGMVNVPEEELNDENEEGVEDG